MPILSDAIPGFGAYDDLVVELKRKLLPILTGLIQLNIVQQVNVQAHEQWMVAIFNDGLSAHQQLADIIQANLFPPDAELLPAVAHIFAAFKTKCEARRRQFLPIWRPLYSSLQHEVQARVIERQTCRLFDGNFVPDQRGGLMAMAWRRIIRPDVEHTIASLHKHQSPTSASAGPSMARCLKNHMHFFDAVMAQVTDHKIRVNYVQPTRKFS